jgi:hypothetical protein
VTTAWPVRLVPAAAGHWPNTLDEAARDELLRLWDDLNLAVEYARDGCWSTGCENLAYRIVALTRLVGAAPWTEVDVKLIRSGVYERIHAEAGLRHPPIDWDEVAAFEQRRADA